MNQTPASHSPLKRRSSRSRLLRRGIGALAVALVALALPAAASAQADDCPNANLRALNNSTHLPDCRAYEMVTSPYKEGFGAFSQTYSDNGAYSYFSVGNFAGNPYGSNAGNQYVATRSSKGWTTISHSPPGDQWVFPISQGAENGLSNDLGSSAWVMHPYAQPGAPDDIYVRRPDGEFSFIGPNPGAGLPTVQGRSADLSHLVVGGSVNLGPLPDNLYEYTDSAHEPAAIQVDNSGTPLAQIDVYCGKGMSEDGRVILFGFDYASDCNTRLWARVGAETTINLAASECTRTATDPGGLCNAPAPVRLGGSALDGSRVLFTTAQQLVDGDTDSSADLYACDIPPGPIAHTGLVNGCPHLRQVSGAADEADVQSVARVADDGSRVYFIARGVLADNQGANDQAALAGADNLYVWQQDGAHPAGHTTFMARLTAGDNLYETTPDGRYLLLRTSTPLVSSGASADTDSVADVYRYDAETETWLRLSTDSTGSGGNAELATLGGNAISGNYRPRVTMTADGRIVVFQTAEALAPADANSVSDVYAWQGGRVSLISADGGEDARITASGTDIFFKTGGHLTAADGDTNPDVYDARVGGGFDLREPAPCEGEGCLGQPSSPPGLATVGSGGSGGQGAARPRFTLRATTAAQRRALAATGRVSLAVTASAPGIVSARATATIAGKRVSVARGRRVVASAGTVQLRLTLSKKARAQLAAKRRLTVRVVVRHSKVARARSMTLSVKGGRS